MIPTPLFRAKVVKRPSAQIKSPYVADIQLDDGRLGLCHTPGLGCSGLVHPGQIVWVSANKPGAKTAYSVQISESTDSEGTYYVGLQPLISQKFAASLLPSLSAEAKWKAEVKVDEHTRLDYMGTLPSGKKIYVEVKNAMISHQTVKPRADRCAVFPDGFRKSKADPISPRAIKHAETLAALRAHPDTEACILLFIVPRDDCEAGLTLNAEDPAYVAAVKAAASAGVQVRAFGLRHALDGSITLAKELRMHL